MIKSEKIKQFSVSVLVVLSLFVSSVAACCCDNHQEKQEVEVASCHSQTGKSAAEKKQVSQAEKEDFQGRQMNIPCECLFDSAPKIVAKSDNVKVEKYIPLWSEKVEAIRGFIAVRAPAKSRFDFEIFRINDSSYNIKSPRAPPRL